MNALRHVNARNFGFRGVVHVNIGMRDVVGLIGRVVHDFQQRLRIGIDAVLLVVNRALQFVVRDLHGGGLRLDGNHVGIQCWICRGCSRHAL